jgi:hypothetical protein
MGFDEMPNLVLKQSLTSGPTNGRKGGSLEYQNQFYRATALTGNGTKRIICYEY